MQTIFTIIDVYSVVALQTNPHYFSLLIKVYIYIHHGSCNTINQFYFLCAFKSFVYITYFPHLQSCAFITSNLCLQFNKADESITDSWKEIISFHPWILIVYIASIKLSCLLFILLHEDIIICFSTSNWMQIIRVNS